MRAYTKDDALRELHEFGWKSPRGFAAWCQREAEDCFRRTQQCRDAAENWGNPVAIEQLPLMQLGCAWRYERARAAYDLYLELTK